MLSRALLIGSLLFWPGPAGTAEELRFAVPAGTTLARTLESGFTLELREFHLTMDGEEVPREALGALDMRIRREQRCEVVDTFETVGVGRPARLLRRFERLGGHQETSLTGDQGTENARAELASRLEGKAVLFAWDEEAGGFRADYASGAEGPAELLAPLEEDLDLRGFLPGRTVSPGEEWDVGVRAFHAVLAPGGDLALQDPEGPGRESALIDLALRNNLVGSVKAKLEGVDGDAAARSARVALAVEASTRVEEPMAAEEIPGAGRGTTSSTIEFHLRGRLVWDVTHGHAVTFELAGPYQVTIDHRLEGELDGESYRQTQQMVLAGDVRYGMRFEPR